MTATDTIAQAMRDAIWEAADKPKTKDTIGLVPCRAIEPLSKLLATTVVGKGMTLPHDIEPIDLLKAGDGLAAAVRSRLRHVPSVHRVGLSSALNAYNIVRFDEDDDDEDEYDEPTVEVIMHTFAEWVSIWGVLTGGRVVDADGAPVETEKLMPVNEFRDRLHKCTIQLSGLSTPARMVLG